MDNEKEEGGNMYAICTTYLKEHGYWAPLVKAIKFLIHFVVVMLLLYCGAIIFAVLEDPESIFLEDSHELRTSHIRHNIGNQHANQTRGNITLLWANIEAKYNISINEHLPEGFREDMRMFLAQISEKATPITSPRTHEAQVTPDRQHVFMKWFYFVTIATTTIGYGHVHPETDKGKLFYIFFSIVGISLMMTLLKSCGTILTAISNKVYAFIIRHVFRDKKVVSDELMSVVLITFMFIIFMLFVVWHDQSIGEAKGWSLLDTFYFWIVTFTTVGFGDVHFSIEVEIEHVYEMLLYRVFGLSFLAGIIDSIQRYMKYRNKVLARTSTARFSQIKGRLIRKMDIRY